MYTNSAEAYIISNLRYLTRVQHNTYKKSRSPYQLGDLLKKLQRSAFICLETIFQIRIGISGENFNPFSVF